MLGCTNLIIAVDHKPLLKIFGDRSLDEISNARLRNLKEKTLCCKFRMIHIPGVRHKAADALSRHPTGSTSPEMLMLPDDIAAASETPTPLPASTAGHSFLGGLRSDENPLESYSTTLDSQLASAATSTLQTMAVTWDRVRLATTGDQDMATLLHTCH